jgi:hypothetical protein
MVTPGIATAPLAVINRFGYPNIAVVIDVNGGWIVKQWRLGI